MDADRFDRLARDVIYASSRRGLFRLLGGGALAGAVVLAEREGAAARCRPRRRRCGPGRCCPKGQICADLATQTCETDPQGTCRTGDDWCANQNKTCNGTSSGCICQTTMEGETRCTQPSSFPHCCSSSAQCVQELDAPGASCIPGTQGPCFTGCSEGDTDKGVCYPPCLV